MNKKIKAICLLFVFLAQTLGVFAIENIQINSQVQVLSREQYPHKKVLKKYEPYLINIVNKNKKPILSTSNSSIVLLDENNKVIEMESRRKIYRNIRRKDIGKYYALGLPTAALGGAIIGFTFGLGTPVAIGLWIIGERPARNAAKENYEIALEFCQTRSIPLRFEHDEIEQILVLVPKNERFSQILVTNVMYEKENKKFDLVINNSIEE